MSVLRAKVPCGTCRSCCVGIIVLHPEKGDVVEDYATREIVNPLTGRRSVALQQTEAGDCVYLSEKGCSIYGRAPVVCKEFDCRRLFTLFSRPQRRQMLRNHMVTEEILAAGRERLGTLQSSGALLDQEALPGVNKKLP